MQGNSLCVRAAMDENGRREKKKTGIVNEIGTIVGGFSSLDQSKSLTHSEI
jgi:hypothetical protein